MSFLFLAVDFSFGQYVYPGGTISTPTTWNGYDFYYIDGNILITTGGSLTIAPNTGNSNPVHVVFRGGFGISIEGTGVINVSGTVARNIFFTADRNDNQVYGESGETWLNLSFNESTGTSVIDYAIIEHGTGDAFGVGGGIDIYANNVTVRNTTIRSCDLSGDGGGIYVFPTGSNVSLQNIKLHDNIATGNGGGLFVDGVLNLEGVEVYNNSGNNGDGIYMNGGSTMNKSLIHNNSGEGIYFNASGGGLINSIVYSNTTGVFFLNAANLVNCDIVNNTTGLLSYSFTAPKIVNTVLWGNTTEYTITSLASMAFANCGIRGGLSGGTDGGGNKTLSATNGADTGPNFVTPSSDFHINAGISPLVDGGTSSYSGITAPATDIEGKSRLSTIDIGAYEFFYYIWSGAMSTNWSTSGNWVGSPSSVPTTISENKVLIPSGCSYYPTSSELILSNRSILTIESQAGLTVSGTTTVGSGCTFLLKSDANGSANFITGSSASGSFNVELFLAGGGNPDYKWHYVTTPVNGISKDVITTNIGNINNLLVYYEPAVITADKNLGWQWHDGHLGTTGFTNLFYTNGYNVYVANNQTAVFAGLILSGSDFKYTNTMLTCGTADPDQNGWNLIGNPFTSVVDAESFVFGADLLGPDPLDKVVYFTKNNGNVAYNSYTHVGTGATRYIPSLQGFFVHGKAGRLKTLTIPASGRVNSISPLYKGTKDAVAFPYLKMNISDGTGSTDEAIIYFFNDATIAFDGFYDAYKMLSANPARAQIYTTANSLKLAMNGLPYPDKITVVPLKVWAGETKNYTINILDLQNLADWKVTLINGVNRIDLKANPNYTFSATASTLIDMSIEFDMSLVTDVNVPSKDLTACWYSNGAVLIKTGLAGFEDNSSVIIYDVNGKVVLSKRNVSLGKGETVEIPVSLANGFYITRIINKDKKMVKKIVISY